MALSTPFTKLGHFVFGRSSKLKNLNLLTPQQRQGMMQLYQNRLESNPLYRQGSSYLQNILSENPDRFNEFEAPLYRRFQEETLPGIGEQFAGAGTGSGALSSSGLNQVLAKAMASLGEDIGAQRGNLTQGALSQAGQYAQQPINNALNFSSIRTTQPFQTSGKSGFLNQLLNAYSQSGGSFGFNQSNPVSQNNMIGYAGSPGGFGNYPGANSPTPGIGYVNRGGF